MKIDPVPVHIVSATGLKASGQVEVQYWDPRARALRALKIFGGCWALALVSVVLPIAHFFLVPGFFLAGPIGAYLVYFSTSVVLGGSGTCPKCNAALVIVRGPEKWPLSELCTKCQASLTILDGRPPGAGEAGHDA